MIPNISIISFVCCNSTRGNPDKHHSEMQARNPIGMRNSAHSLCACTHINRARKKTIYDKKEIIPRQKKMNTSISLLICILLPFYHIKYLYVYMSSISLSTCLSRFFLFVLVFFLIFSSLSMYLSIYLSIYLIILPQIHVFLSLYLLSITTKCRSTSPS